MNSPPRQKFSLRSLAALAEIRILGICWQISGPEIHPKSVKMNLIEFPTRLLLPGGIVLCLLLLLWRDGAHRVGVEGFLFLLVRLGTIPGFLLLHFKDETPESTPFNRSRTADTPLKFIYEMNTEKTAKYSQKLLDYGAIY